MTNEERDIISRFIARFGGAPQGGNVWGSVPATQQPPPMPPIDPEADQLIGTLFAQYPEARYRVTQMAFVQEAALTEAQHRIEQLQWQLQQTQQQAAQAPQSRGMFGGLFGGGGRPAAPSQPQPAPPQYAPYAPQPQMFQQGSGFLGSALHTAAGVAGGMVLGNLFMDMFQGRSNYGGGFGMGGLGGGFGGGFGGGMTPSVTNNYYDANQAPDQSAGSDPWGGAGGQLDNSGGDSWSNQNDSNTDSGDSSNGDMGGGDFGGGDSGGDDSGGGDWGN